MRMILHLTAVIENVCGCVCVCVCKHPQVFIRDLDVYKKENILIKYGETDI